MFRSISRLRRRQLPTGPFLRRTRIVLSMLTNLGWALLVLVLLPKQLGVPLLTLTQGLPDVAYTLLVSGSVALVWAVARTVWALLTLRASRAYQASEIRCSRSQHEPPSVTRKADRHGSTFWRRQAPAASGSSSSTGNILGQSTDGLGPRIQDAFGFMRHCRGATMVTLLRPERPVRGTPIGLPLPHGADDPLRKRQQWRTCVSPARLVASCSQPGRPRHFPVRPDPLAPVSGRTTARGRARAPRPRRLAVSPPTTCFTEPR